MALCPTSTSCSMDGSRNRREDTQGDRLVVEKLDEPQPRAATAVALAGLELVGDRLDDRDPEPSLGEVVVGPGTVGVEAGTFVGDLDDEPVGLQLVQDLDDAFATLAVSVPHGVRAGFGHGELQVTEGFLAKRPQP